MLTFIGDRYKKSQPGTIANWFQLYCSAKDRISTLLKWSMFGLETEMSGMLCLFSQGMVVTLLIR